MYRSHKSPPNSTSTLSLSLSPLHPTPAAALTPFHSMRLHHLLLLLLPLLLSLANGAASSPPPAPSIRFKLFRHPLHLVDVARSDALRHRLVAGTIDRRRRMRKACEAPGAARNGTDPSSSDQSFAMPVSSGAYTGTGQYFARFQVGTPAQKFLLVVDTGSDLTWMKCRYPGGGGGGKGARLFDASASKTFRPIGCASNLCKSSLPFSLAQCPAPSSPCQYDYSYSDGSRAQGLFANESATVILSNRRRAKLRGIVVGCTSSFVGSSFRAADGVLGLGYSETSFAARATSLFGGKFSYCLVDHLSPKNVSNYLVFGGGGESLAASSAGAMRYADLVIDSRLEPFYAVKVSGISVGKELLAIPRAVWDASRGGGTILDSGTSLAVLVEPAYKAVTAALSRVIRGRYPRVEVKPFEFCYNVTGAARGRRRFDWKEVPRLVVHLRGYGGGLVRLEPPVKSYVVDVADGVKCLGFVSAPWPGVSTIGNIMQQNHHWEFDIGKRRLGFAPSNC